MPCLLTKKRPERPLETKLKRSLGKKTKHSISKFRRTRICLPVNLEPKNLFNRKLKLRRRKFSKSCKMSWILLMDFRWIQPSLSELSQFSKNSKKKNSKKRNLQLNQRRLSNQSKKRSPRSQPSPDKNRLIKMKWTLLVTSASTQISLTTSCLSTSSIMSLTSIGAGSVEKTMVRKKSPTTILPVFASK